MPSSRRPIFPNAPPVTVGRHCPFRHPPSLTTANTPQQFLILDLDLAMNRIALALSEREREDMVRLKRFKARQGGLL